MLLALALGIGTGQTFAATAPAEPAGDRLPPEVRSALQRAGLPDEALFLQVLDASSGRRVAQWQAQVPFNPASLTKLLTTYAALDRLGPAFTWSTPVWLSGTLGPGGVLEGSVHVRGQGDPTLVMERVWLLLRRLQQAGVREIRGDIVLDNTAFAASEEAPGEFDGEALRPYNVKPAALLMNFRSAVYTWVPDPSAGVAHVLLDPPLAAQTWDRTVPLAAGPCGDWRQGLRAVFEPGSARFGGSYPAACGERSWAVADPHPASWEARLLEGLWREMGGELRGSVREGPAPVDRKPLFELHSPPLAEVVRDINKFSHNMMAQQLFLTLALVDNPRQPATGEAARAWLWRWLTARTGEPRPPAAGSLPELVLDNGSGLSRHTRITAQRLARLLLQGHDSPVMSELMSSLPIAGVDGTLRRSRATPGRAHLKTGSLRDVTAVAGWVLTPQGRRLIVVAGLHHPQAAAGRPVLDALIGWTMRDPTARQP